MAWQQREEIKTNNIIFIIIIIYIFQQIDIYAIERCLKRNYATQNEFLGSTKRIASFVLFASFMLLQLWLHYADTNKLIFLPYFVSVATFLLPLNQPRRHIYVIHSTSVNNTKYIHSRYSYTIFLSTRICRTIIA